MVVSIKLLSIHYTTQNNKKTNGPQIIYHDFFCKRNDYHHKLRNQKSQKLQSFKKSKYHIIKIFPKQSFLFTSTPSKLKTQHYISANRETSMWELLLE